MKTNPRCLVWLRRVGVLALLPALSACFTLSAEECTKMDWTERGRRAANVSFTYEDNLKTMKEKCTLKHGIKVDEAAFEAGHAEGTQKLCSPANGASDGRNGIPPRLLCSQPPQPSYLEAHAQGVLVYCRPRNAYDHGREGGSALQRCHESQASAFSTAYKLGREVFDKTSKADDLKREAAGNRSIATDTKRKVEDRNAALRRAFEAEEEERKLRVIIRQIEIQATALPN